MPKAKSRGNEADTVRSPVLQMISIDLCSSSHFQYVEFNVDFGRKKLTIT